MKRISSHKGSALLIVLGMLAFMVVSAVAFSMFMRQSRLPSSFLRQQLTSAQLVKAGLAEAMTRIDSAIGDDPAPGVGNSTGRNYWRNRVYMGGAGESSAGDTVSTMPLEGLAYLPPPLINTVRHWARRSSTAVWDALGYDAGRYAFTAIDVSDYFDLNRVHAGLMRDSSPSNRISIASVFMDDKGNFDAERAEAFEKFIENVNKDTFKTRLVSLADYNLALHRQGQATGFESPFCKYFESGTGDGIFYGEGDEDSIKKQTFVTDSWYPDLTAATNTTKVVLTDEDGQPFADATLDERVGVDAIGASKTKAYAKMREHMNVAESLALKDYLDVDDTPSALAWPTMERTPMLVALQAAVDGATLNAKLTPTVVSEDAQTGIARKKWSLTDIGGEILISGGAVYPFKRSSAMGNPGSYDCEVLVKAFFTDASAVASNFSRTRLSGFNLHPDKSEWGQSGTRHSDNGYWYATAKGSAKVSKSPIDEEDAKIEIDFNNLNFSLSNESWDVYGIRYSTLDPSQCEFDAGVMEHPLEYLKSDGSRGNLRDLASANGPISLKLHFMLWVRITEGGRTVDMFPATFADDATYNGITSSLDGYSLGEPSQKPVVPIGDGIKLDYDPASFTSQAGNVSPTVEGTANLNIVCNDPRYNWAPEDWYSVESGGGYDGWKANIQRFDGTRPADIFQFVANQGYLQSMGELQFLPLVRNGYNDFNGDELGGSFFTGVNRYDGKPFAERTSVGALANRSYMWRSRDLFGKHRPTSDADDPYMWDILDSVGGTAISPYAKSDTIMAALVNTPYDWIVASENDKDDLKFGATLSEGLDYCFNDQSSEAPLDWEDLKTIANNLSAKLRSSDDWERDWSEWSEWGEDGGAFFGASPEHFHDVDRKFLFGYWRNCFANRQQLFLVFVRAEPSVMGGASAGHTPAQLGARAVALVWREPVSSIEASGSSEEGTAAKPHRMRILFYHQFN